MGINDRYLDVIKAYDIDVTEIRRVRSGYLCICQKDTYLLREYSGKDKKLESEEKILNRINEYGNILCDVPIRNKEGILTTKADDGVVYVLKKWYYGREFDVKNAMDACEGASLLAALHHDLRKIEKDFVLLNKRDIVDDYERHNREMWHIKKYIREKTPKTPFEIEILRRFDEFYDKACLATDRIKRYAPLAREGIVHGDYNYHNIMFGTVHIITGFESMHRDVEIADLYNYLRKVMEKHSWNVELGRKIVERYDKICPLDEIDREIMRINCMYPEKYWKILNRYYNSRKFFVPDKSIQKLEKIYTQEDAKDSFILKV